MGENPVHAELRIAAPDTCQVAALSEPDTSVSRVSQTSIPNDERQITEELAVEDPPPNEGADPTPVDESNSVFRVQRPIEQGCACETVERYGCPVREAYADGGDLFLAFYAEELATVRQIIADLREISDGVHLQHLHQTGNESSHDLVAIDRGLFTDRQFEVLRKAHEMGYFAHPKQANASEVAAALDISTTTLSEHLMTAQGKLLDELLRE